VKTCASGGAYVRINPYLGRPFPVVNSITVEVLLLSGRRLPWLLRRKPWNRRPYLARKMGVSIADLAFRRDWIRRRLQGVRPQ
jgi:hypothetical protein